MAKTAQDVEQVNGIVLRAFPVRNAGKYKVYDFVLRTGTGDLKVSRFGSGVQEFVGENVSFDASYNDQYDRYTVQGDIVASEQEGVAETPEVVEAPKAKRGRPATAKATTATAAQTQQESAREAYRDLAVQTVVHNLTSARAVGEQLCLKIAGVQDLIALADIIGRTQTAIHLSAEKGNR